MTSVWITVAALAVGTVVSKAIGPLAFGHLTPTPRAMAVTQLVAPAILAGLVVYETLSDGHGGISVDARVAGLAAAAAALVARLPLLAVVLLAAAATALVRAVSG
jgi:uncharacterized membrane protein